MARFILIAAPVSAPPSTVWVDALTGDAKPYRGSGA
jgi:hypothetical protein